MHTHVHVRTLTVSSIWSHTSTGTDFIKLKRFYSYNTCTVLHFNENLSRLVVKEMIKEGEIRSAIPIRE